MEVYYESNLNQDYLVKQDGSKVYFAQISVEFKDGWYDLNTYIAEDGSRMMLEKSYAQGTLFDIKIKTIDDMVYSYILMED
jgi:hypothetical protein